MELLFTKFLKPRDIQTSVQPPAAFRLSDDILISVFLLNVDKPIFDPYIPKNPRPTPHRTTRLTSQVCRRWRQVALTCPALWSNIELSPKYVRWVQEIIRRATMRDDFGQVSLTCSSRHALSQITPQLLSHASSYHGMVSRDQWTLLTNELASPTTQLESLCVLSENAARLLDGMTLPPSMTIGKPGLKTLSFDTCLPIDITQPNLASLTTFVIGLQNIYFPFLALEEVVGYKTSDILCALANMPLLEELSISVWLWIAIDSIHSVYLPHLARLKLDGDNLLISRLLSNIKFPLSCSLRIKCREEEGRDLEATLPTNEMIVRIVTPVARSMAYAFTHNLRIHLSSTLLIIEDLPLMPNRVPRNPGRSDVWSTQLDCRHLNDWESIFDQVIAIFHGAFQTTTHLTLDLSIPSYYRGDPVPRFLQPFTKLVTINLNGKSGFEQFSLFKVTSGNGEEDFLPALRNIKVVGLLAKAWSLDGLIGFLARRLKRDKGLHTLDLYFDSTNVKTKKIDITKRQLSRLQQIVVDINAYYIQYFGSDNARLIKAMISHPTLGNAGGRCRIERFNR